MAFVEGGLNLNLGANYHARPEFTNVDIHPYPGVQVICDLEKTWPWEDGSVDFILAEDIFEHLHDPIHAMNETWRVLKMGGEISIWVPSTDGRGAFQDPTHVSYWNPNTFLYYSANHPEYHDIYPHLIKSSFDISFGESPPSPLKVIWIRAVCRKVPNNVKQLVHDGVPGGS